MNEARGANEWQEAYGGGFGMQGTRLTHVPVELLDPWQDADGKAQPFRSYGEAELTELAENIRQHGIITPLRVRPMGRRFQILAGHNRCEAAKKIGLRTVPAIVESVDDDEAAQLLVDSNLQQRQKLLPSEKAFAYKLKLEAMKRKAGRPSATNCGQNVHNFNNDGNGGQNVHNFNDDGNGGQNVHNFNDDGNGGQNVHHFGTDRSRESLGEIIGESGRQIQRYIRLTYLIPELLQLVDADKIKVIAGVELSFLPLNMQNILLTMLQDEGVKLSTAKAAMLHREMPTTEEHLRFLLESKPKQQAPVFKLSVPELSANQIEQLSMNAEFQNELRRIVAELSKKYLSYTTERK